MSAGVVSPTEVRGELVTATAWLTDHMTTKTCREQYWDDHDSVSTAVPRGRGSRLPR